MIYYVSISTSSNQAQLLEHVSLGDCSCFKIQSLLELVMQDRLLHLVQHCLVTILPPEELLQSANIFATDFSFFWVACFKSWTARALLLGSKHVHNVLMAADNDSFKERKRVHSCRALPCRYPANWGHQRGCQATHWKMGLQKVLYLGAEVRFPC